MEIALRSGQGMLIDRPSAQHPGELDTLAHLTLQLGRLLLQNGSDTEQVQASMARFVAGLAVHLNLMVSYEVVLVTLVAGEHIRTKIGHRLPAIGVGMAAIEAVNRLID